MPPQQLPSRKLPLAITLIIVSIIYAMWHYVVGGQQSVTVTAPTVTTTSPIVIPTQTTTSAPANPQVVNPSSTPAPTPVPQKLSGLYADGSYTGNPADAYYGTVQVQAIIQNGKIANVKFLQYPSDRNTSRYINSQAMPMLTQEAIQAQSAQVDGVSGATATSGAFKQSLASALAQAKN